MDAIIEEIGPFGRFQKLMIALFGSLFILTSSNLYFTIFTSAEPKIFCKYNTNTNIININNQTLSVCAVWKNLTSSLKHVDYSNETSLLFKCEIDKTYYKKTIVTEWNLFCERKYLAGLTQSLYMAGSLCSLGAGYLGDNFGRRRITIIFLALLSTTLCLSCFLQLNLLKLNNMYQYTFYCITSFFEGLFTNCIYCNTFVLLIELTTPKYHTFFSIIGLYFFVFGELCVLVIAYIYRNWYVYHWITASYSIIILALTALFFPESPRWQIQARKYKEADLTLKKIALINKRTYKKAYFDCETNDLLSKKEIEKVVISEENDLSIKPDSKIDKINHKENIFHHLFIPWRHAMKTILLTYMFIVLAILYFGISFGVTSIDSLNPYVMYLFSAIAEIIGYTLSLINIKMGRKKFNIVFLIISSLSCFTVGILTFNDDSNNILSIKSIFILTAVSIGKCMASAAFNNIWVYAAELYSTSSRNSVILLLNAMSRIGSLSAPFLILFGTVIYKPLPYIVFCTLSLLAAFLGFLLPETFHN